MEIFSMYIEFIKQWNIFQRMFGIYNAIQKNVRFQHTTFVYLCEFYERFWKSPKTPTFTNRKRILSKPNTHPNNGWLRGKPKMLHAPHILWKTTDEIVIKTVDLAEEKTDQVRVDDFLHLCQVPRDRSLSTTDYDKSIIQPTGALWHITYRQGRQARNLVQPERKSSYGFHAELHSFGD